MPNAGLKESGLSYRLAFVSKDNPLKNILRKSNKVNKSTKVRQYRKILISLFKHFSSVSLKNLFLQGRLGTW